jgi:hypothetical protein
MNFDGFEQRLLLLSFCTLGLKPCALSPFCMIAGLTPVHSISVFRKR